MRNIHIGAMGWSYSFWVGDFYSEGTDSGNYLAEYSKHFDTVEVDSTFYRIPSEETVVKWRNQTPPDFLFSAKFPQVITHVRMLKNCERETERFVKHISLLGNKLGPLLLQFPSRFGEEQLGVLRDFLSSLPDGHRLVVEVRNRKVLGDRLFSVLRDNGVALAFVDSPFMSETVEVTADFVYFRWEGNRRNVKGTVGRIEVDRTEDTKKWAGKIGRLMDGTDEVFGYFSKYYSGYPPSDAKQLASLLDRG